MTFPDTIIGIRKNNCRLFKFYKLSALYFLDIDNKNKITMLKKLISYLPLSNDLGILVLRVTAGILMITHGIPKMLNYGVLKDIFPDPFGIGSPASLGLVVFAEIVCSVLLALGLFTRFSLIPLIVTMLTAVFIVHFGDPFSKMELGLFYLLVYAALFLTGPGRYSLDMVLFRKIKEETN
jgi:putative oxidoreductase